MVSVCWFSHNLIQKVCNFLGSCSTGESGGFCCQVPPDPALKCYLQGLDFGTITALRGNSHRSIVVISNYKFGPMTAEPCRAKDHPLHSPSNLFRPLQNPPLPRDRAFRTGLGGGAGYRPRVRRAYFDAVYRHSRARRRSEYRHYGAVFKVENQTAIRPAAFMGISCGAVTGRARSPLAAPIVNR
jgi:hypothetical protein